jgi:hypothetical protein
MKEIDRRVFASLNVEDGVYYVLVDGCFHSNFIVNNDKEAIEKFQTMVL